MKWLILVSILLWASQDVVNELPKVASGLPYIYDYITGMFPPDWSILSKLVDPLVETLRMAVVSIFLSTIIAIPLSFLAARETTPNVLVYAVATSLINFLRTLPTLLWAILFVAMVGLGPLAGIFALTAHCIGTLGKYFQEAIEATVPKIKEVLEAMQVDGATEIQILYHGILPEVAPLFASYVLYYTEWAVRVGTTLGLVGAGGVGLILTMTIRLFKRQQTSAIVIVILSLVMAIHLFSRVVRRGLA